MDYEVLNSHVERPLPMIGLSWENRAVIVGDIELQSIPPSFESPLNLSRFAPQSGKVLLRYGSVDWGTVARAVLYLPNTG